MGRGVCRDGRIAVVLIVVPADGMGGLAVSLAALADGMPEAALASFAPWPTSRTAC